MTREKDITGQRFGRLVAIKKIYTDKKNYRGFWLFKCDCGKEKVIDKTPVVNGKTLSCGCYHKEIVSKIKTVHGLLRKNINRDIYIKWRDMKNRCYNPKRDRYKNYGGRGIDVGERLKRGFTIEEAFTIPKGIKRVSFYRKINQENKI